MLQKDPQMANLCNSEQFAIRNPNKADELESWDDATFLNKAKVTVQGKITRTALILLVANLCNSEPVLPLKFQAYTLQDPVYL